MRLGAVGGPGTPLAPTAAMVMEQKAHTNRGSLGRRGFLLALLAVLALPGSIWASVRTVVATG